MTNTDTKKEDSAKRIAIPKMPPMNFGKGIPSMFSKGRTFTSKGTPQGKFNQATFHTQHKGGPVGGGK